ncbi:MAG: hypothetical protein JNM82_04900 [Rhodocyclaceae bacterium]|nr:hypothetical protein [Rhodocyclaceae bacterium]
MIVRLGRRFGSWAVFGGHAVILAFAVQAEDADLWKAAWALMGMISFFAWIGAYRRWRAIGDTPTSKVASAAQGYTELVGWATGAGQGPSLLDPVASEPCRWYRFETREKRTDSKGKTYWTTVQEGQSEQPFGLDDGTGVCIVIPSDAEMLVAETKRVPEGTRREHILWLIRDEDPVYALGQFETQWHAAPAVIPSDILDRDSDRLLASWQQDVPAMLARFDSNRDRRLDERELALARKEARRKTVELRQGARPELKPEHTLRSPSDGRLFLLADRSPDAIASTYKWLTGIHLAVFFAGLLASYFLITGYSGAWR